VLEPALQGLWAIAAIAFAALTGNALLGLWRLRRLPAEWPLTTPTVSAIVPARDEAARIGGTIARLLAQERVALEVVAIDDASTDATPRLLDDHARGEPRLQVLHLHDLPAGWLGKCHALQRGSERARGEWLLFSDADAWFGTDVVARAIAAAERGDFAHLTLMPGLAATTTFGRIALLGFCIPGLRQIAWLGRSRRVYLGFGAFNLVRRDAYTKVGGHEPLRLTVIDDMQLGRLVQQAGFRTGVFFCADVEVQWVTDLRSHFRLLEKNIFAVFGFRTELALAVSAVAGLLHGSGLGVVAGLALLSQAIPATAMALRYGWSPWLGLAVPWLAPPLQVATLLRSMVRTLARGGIAWRGRFHALAELRHHASR
jgi:hypothetical protein